MPELFPSLTAFGLCFLVVAGAQLIYATVGFGAGMFAVALLALLLPDLRAAVVTLLLITMVTETWVLLTAWRDVRWKLLVGLLPTTAAGLWLGAILLKEGDVAWLKRLLGLVVLAAGSWFLWQATQRTRRCPTNDSNPPQAPATEGTGRSWPALPVGLAAGVLAGMFGTGGPPVIVYLRAHGLGKGGFRATILWYFLLMSMLRLAAYGQQGLLTVEAAWAAAWLLPACALGTILGMKLHRNLSEHKFALAVAILLMLLGVLLLVSTG